MAFAGAIAAYALSCLAMFGVYIFITQYLQLVAGLSPLHAGVATLPWALAFVAGSLLAPKLAQRITPVTVLWGSLLVAALGFALLALTSPTRTGLAVVVAGSVVMSLGMAPVFTLGNEMIIAAAPAERAGAASAISETASEFSGALGIAVFGSLGMLLYRALLASSHSSAAISPESLATLGGAGQPAAEGQALLGAARTAFVDAFQAVAAAAAVIVCAASVLTAKLLRGDAGGGNTEPALADGGGQR